MCDRSVSDLGPARRVESAVPPSTAGSTDSERELAPTAGPIRRNFSTLSQVRPQSVE